jgi:hypothetical protein
VLAAETARKEDAGPGGLLFTMIDELNKNPPREGTSPIKDVLLDIAERGRCLGIILIGARAGSGAVGGAVSLGPCWPVDCGPGAYQDQGTSRAHEHGKR